MNDLHIFERVFAVDVAVATVVFLLVCAMLVFALVRYRSGRGHEASQKTEHKLLEVCWALVVATVAIILIVFTANANLSERASLGQPQLRVAVTAYQWCWSFHYLGTSATVTGTCQGTPASEPTLVLPRGEIVQFLLRSNDVVHEWWVPATGYKEEAFPDHVNTFEMRFTSLGRWPGRCSEFCGLYHDDMDFWLEVVPAPAFTVFLRSTARAGR